MRALESYQLPQWGEPCDDRTIDDPPKEREGYIQLLCRSFIMESSDVVSGDVTHGLSVLAKAALTLLDDCEEPELFEVHRSEELSIFMLHEREFSEYLVNHPTEIIKEIYDLSSSKT